MSLKSFAALSLLLMSAGTQAAADAGSLRPKARPAVQVHGVHLRELLVTPVSLRPQARPAGWAARPTAAAPAATAEDARLQGWIAGYRRRALAAGIPAQVFDRAFRGVTYDPQIIARDRSQTEFTKTVEQYLAIAASDKRIADGRAALAAEGRTLARIEARYGVDRDIVTAIWGLESAYGTRRGDLSVIRSLATLAFDGRRGQFFEQQLTEALRILARGDTTPEKMTGSWAGAMGHTQFIPTSYQAYAVDFTGDGRRDIWSADPSDALASTAAYLERFGWIKGMPWGVEVTLPRDFDYGQLSSKVKRMPSDWARAGVLGMDGRPVPDHGSAYVLLPAGARGAAFLVFKNFDVIKRYNNSDLYALGVGHLSDRIIGGDAVQGGWPEDDRALVRAERHELQRRLTAKGFDTGGIDGNIGPDTRAALMRYQRSIGAVPDGNASWQILKRLR